MHKKVTPILVSLIALAISACGSGGGGEGASSGGSSGGGAGAGGNAGQGGSAGGGGSVVCQGTSIVAKEVNDYSFTSHITIPPMKVQPKTALTFDWSGLSKDFLGNDLDPQNGIGMVSLIPWSLTVDDVQTKMDNEDLDNQYIISNVPLSLKTGGRLTSTKLLDLTLNGGTIGDGGTIAVDQVMSYFDPDKYDPAKNSFTFLVASGTSVGHGTKMIQSFVLDPSSSNTNVTVSNSSTSLAFTAVIDRLAPTGVTAGKGGITIDWSQIGTNAMGRTFNSVDIDRVIVAHYTQTPAELQQNDTFLKIESIASALYSKTLDVTSPRVDLSTLTDSSNKPFAGIDASGTWIVALQCQGNCRNPAPLYLAILKPCS